jgi:hypothetical protein
MTVGRDAAGGRLDRKVDVAAAAGLDFLETKHAGA